MTPAELRELLSRNPDLTLVTDETGYTTPEPFYASAHARATERLSEYQMQAAVFAECDRRALHDERWRMVYANVNGQYRRGQRPEPGLRAGVPDIFLAVPSGMYHGLYCELKVGKNKPSREQLEWLRRLRVQGYACHVVYDDPMRVIAIIDAYLEDTTP